MPADSPELPDEPTVAQANAEPVTPAQAEGDGAAAVEAAIEATQTVPTSEPAPVTTDSLSPAEAKTAATDSLSPAEAKSATADSMSPAACGAKLADLFPALFQPISAGPPQPVKPIKLRIQADILARAPDVFTKRILGIYFSRYTTSNAYLKALTQAPTRFDLDGNPAGEIDIEHRTAAVQELARRREIAQAKRQAEMQAQRERQRAQAPQSPVEGASSDVSLTEQTPVRPPRRHDERRPPRHVREPRSPIADDRSPRSSQPPRPEQARRRDQRDRTDRRDQAPRQGPPPAEVPGLPVDPATRERALLLRNFESSPLSKANFCALKRISEAELDMQLDQARAERGGPRKPG